ncbi:MAG: ABC transporter permease [archaeon]|jgi:putative ABC transport system permease protein
MIGILNFVIRNLRRRKLRNWITIAGIIIGVIAIVSLISLSEGLKSAINNEFNNLGTNRITVTSKYASFGGSRSNQGLTDNDIKVVEKVSDVDFASGSLSGFLETKYNQKTLMTSYTSYDPEHFQEMLKQNNKSLEKGNYITDEKSKSVIVGYSYIDESKNKDLFDKTLDLGKKIKISGTDYTVVGVLKKTGDVRSDTVMYISNNNLKEITNSETYDKIYAIAKEGKDVEVVAARIQNKLEKARDAKDIIATSPIQESKSQQDTLGMVTIVIIGIACISLLVGGIGILNSMYTSVFERKKEIGVLKAIGAKKRDILMIFLLESGIIGLIGGTIGVLLGFGLAGLVKLVAAQIGITITISITLNIILLALGFSFLIGVISGMIPAYIASSQAPVDALREE